MQIDAITTCVGDLYGGYLARSLPIWLDSLDSLTIVTEPGDPLLAWPITTNLHVIVTDVFTRDGAYFNKGAALNVALALMRETDWLLHVDADIIPPADWRRVVTPRCERGWLHGAQRHDERGRPLTTRSAQCPLGFFQLWHSGDPHAQPRPLFPEYYEHAGCCDVDFAERWPRQRWRMLPISLVHQGQRRINWFGAGNQRPMQTLLAQNLRAYRRDKRRQHERPL